MHSPFPYPLPTPHCSTCSACLVVVLKQRSPRTTGFCFLSVMYEYCRERSVHDIRESMKADTTSISFFTSHFPLWLTSAWSARRKHQEATRRPGKQCLFDPPTATPHGREADSPIRGGGSVVVAPGNRHGRSGRMVSPSKNHYVWYGTHCTPALNVP